MDRATPGEIEAIEREQQRLCWEEVARLRRHAPVDRVETKAVVLAFMAQPEVVRLPDGGTSLQSIERQAIEQALERTGGHQRRAAELLGITPRVLNYKMQHLGIRRPCERVA